MPITSGKKIFLLTAILLFAISAFLPLAQAQQTEANAAIALAQGQILTCYQAVKEAEAAGANITALVAILNDAGTLLSSAEFAYSVNDFGTARNLAVQSQSVSGGLLSEANTLRATAAQQRTQDFLIYVVGSIIGAFAVLGAGLAAWVYLKRKHKTTGAHENVSSKHKVILLVVISVSALLVASPALQRLLVYPQTEGLTELWLLGPEHTDENYPSNITRNQNYDVFLGISNHLGQCAYYVVEVKFRNENMPAPDDIARTPSSLPSLFSMTFFVADKEMLERRLTFSVDYRFNEALSRVEFNSVTLNGALLSLQGITSEWNAATNRFYGNLIFELWIYNESQGIFEYHERFVDLELNMITT